MSRGLEISAKRQRKPNELRLINPKVTSGEIHPAASPQWVSLALKSATSLLSLQPNWDTYGAPAIVVDTIITGMQVLADVMLPNSPPPVFVPTSLGGCQLEWHTSRQDLEIEVAPGREAFVFFDDRQRGIQGEGNLTNHIGKVRLILKEIA